MLHKHNKIPCPVGPVTQWSTVQEMLLKVASLMWQVNSLVNQVGEVEIK